MVSRVRWSRGRTVTSLALLAIVATGAWLRWWGYDYGLPHPVARPDEERIVGRAFAILASGDFQPRTFTYPGLLIYADTLALALYTAFGKLSGNYDSTFDDHPILTQYSKLPPSLESYLNRHADPLAVFDPFTEKYRAGAVEPYFYGGDTFYIPFSGFGAVERGGPIVTIWALKKVD